MMSRLLGYRVPQALLLSGALGCDRHDEARVVPPPEPAVAAAIPVRARLVRQGDFVLSLVTSGEVRAARQAEVRLALDGTIAEVLVRQGQAVAEGDALARLDPAPLELSVGEATAAVEQAEALYRAETVPDSIVTGVAAPPERRRMALARSGLGVAQARLARARLALQNAVVRAPIGGVIDGFDVHPREYVAAGTLLGSIVDLRQLVVAAQVFEQDVSFVRIGGEAAVTVAGGASQPVLGRVTAILPVVDSLTRSARVLVQVAGDGMLRPGMSAEVRLEATRVRNRLLVPAAALLERDGRPLLFRVRGERAEWVYVRPGRSNGDETEILPDSVTGTLPLLRGDTVLVEGHLALAHDAPVRVELAAVPTGVPSR